jgi:hypothetical protein
MENRIISKFKTATEEGIETLQFLTTTIAREKFGLIISKELLEEYIANHLDRKALLAEMNSLSNQWIVVYVNDEPAGYARITSKGKKPHIHEHEKIIRLADFGILKKYDDPQIAQALYDKCFSVCRGYDGIWINEYSQSPFITLFEGYGFSKLDEVPDQYELPLPAVYFFREKVR